MLRSPAVKRVVVRPEDVDKEALHKARSGNVAFPLWKVTLGLAHAGEVLPGDVKKGALHELCSNILDLTTQVVRVLSSRLTCLLQASQSVLVVGSLSNSKFKVRAQRHITTIKMNYPSRLMRDMQQDTEHTRM